MKQVDVFSVYKARQLTIGKQWALTFVIMKYPQILALLLDNKYYSKYQPSGEGGTRSPPAPPAKSKWPPGGSKMADGVLKDVYP